MTICKRYDLTTHFGCVETQLKCNLFCYTHECCTSIYQGVDFNLLMIKQIR